MIYYLSVAYNCFSDDHVLGAMTLLTFQRKLFFTLYGQNIVAPKPYFISTSHFLNINKTYTNNLKMSYTRNIFLIRYILYIHSIIQYN